MPAGIVHHIPEKFYAALAERIEFRDGVPHWKCDCNNKVKAGDTAGSIDDRGYRRIGVRIDRETKLVRSHRLHWFMVHGTLPDEIDHKDRDVSNDRIENLRIATHGQNIRNIRYKKGTSEYHGVSWAKHVSKWIATIWIVDRNHHLGCFAVEEEAAKAYDAAAVKFGFGEWAPLNFPNETPILSE